MQKLFSDEAWEDYGYWQQHDAKILHRINALIDAIERHAFTGLGKPEPLRHALHPWWSRRIDREHRLVYRVKENQIHVLQCRYNY